MSDLPTEIEIKGKPVKLTVPASFAVRYSVVAAMATNSMLAKGAALGLCNEQINARMVSLRNTYKHDPMPYGEAVINWLVEESGWTFADLNLAGDLAVALIWRSLPEWEAVETTRDFSEPEDTGPDSTN